MLVARDSLIRQLQQQIDDLTVFLEEERLNHRETRRKAADNIQDKVDELTKQHDEAIRYVRTSRTRSTN